MTRLFPSFRTEGHATQTPGSAGRHAVAVVGDTPPQKYRRTGAAERDAGDTDAAVEAAVQAERERALSRIEALEAAVEAAQQQVETVTSQFEEQRATQQREYSRTMKLRERETGQERSRRVEAETEVIRLKTLLQEEQKKLALHQALTAPGGAPAPAGGSSAAGGVSSELIAELTRQAKDLLRTSKGGPDAVIDQLCAGFVKSKQMMESQLAALRREHQASQGEAMKAAQRLEAAQAQLREVQRQVATGGGAAMPGMHTRGDSDGAATATATVLRTAPALQKPTPAALAASWAAKPGQQAPALNIVRTGAISGGLGGIDGGGSFLGTSGAHQPRTAGGANNDGGRFIVTGADGRGGQIKVLLPLVENANGSGRAPQQQAGGTSTGEAKSRGAKAAAAAPAVGLQRWVSAASNRIVASPPEPDN